MDYRKAAWLADYQRIKPHIPTVLRFFGESWLDEQTDDFLEETTHQNECHPLLSILMNIADGRRAYEADDLESLFQALVSRLPNDKIARLKAADTWATFLAEFLDLVVAERLSHLGEIELEPQDSQGNRPDIVWTVAGTKVGIEANMVVETREQRRSKLDAHEDLADAVRMSRLVTEYRQSTSRGARLPNRIRKRLKEVQEWDARWEDPAPRAFGGTPIVAPRFANKNEAIRNLTTRKKGSEQLRDFDCRFLLLFLPTDFFPYPYDFHRITEVERHAMKFEYAGVVHHAFFGTLGDPLYSHHFIAHPDSYVRERMEQAGRFRKGNL